MKSTHEKHFSAMTAIARLKRQGCVVLSARTDLTIPVIEILDPSKALKEKATQIVEKHNGLLSRICVARLSGCLIRWPDDGLPTPSQLVKELNPYAPEMVSVWPKIF